MTNTKINFCGVEFKNPIVTASGTFGFGMEYNERYIKQCRTSKSGC